MWFNAKAVALFWKASRFQYVYNKIYSANELVPNRALKLTWELNIIGVFLVVESATIFIRH